MGLCGVFQSQRDNTMTEKFHNELCDLLRANFDADWDLRWNLEEPGFNLTLLVWSDRAESEIDTET